MKTMTIVAYIDPRPVFFVVGLLVFVGIGLLLRRSAKARLKMVTLVLISSLAFAALFACFLTSYGPFVGQKVAREFRMTWRINEHPLGGRKQAEVLLFFADYPGSCVGEYSDELAAHLRDMGDDEVKVQFEVTSDYGKVRGFHMTEVAGLRRWASEGGCSISSGEPSPWR